MTTHPTFPLLLESGSQLVFTPCPGLKGVDLTTSLAQLKESGVDVVLTMMPAEDLEQEGVANLGEEAGKLDFEWFHLPVEDDALPEQPFEQAWAEHKKAILALLKEGKSFAVHCKGGTGRTGLMIGILLAELGFSYDEIVQKVQSVRPKSLTMACHTSYLKPYVEAL